MINNTIFSDFKFVQFQNPNQKNQIRQSYKYDYDEYHYDDFYDTYYSDFDHLQRKDYFLQMQPPRNIFVRVISKIKNFISRIHYMCVKTVESRDPTKADKAITVTIF